MTILAVAGASPPRAIVLDCGRSMLENGTSPLDHNRGAYRKTAVFSAVDLEAVLHKSRRGNGEPKLQHRAGCFGDLLQQVAFDGRVRQVAVAACATSKIAQDAAGVVGVVREEFFEYPDAVQ